MKTTPVSLRFWTLFGASIVATMSPCTARAAEPPVIVDTKFSEIDAAGKPEVVPVPLDEDALPLKSPTYVGEMASDPAHPTSVRVAKEAIGSLKVPYLLLTAGRRVDKPEAVANVAVAWRLSKLNLSSGAYEISFDALARQSDKSGGRFRVNFLGTDKKLVALHPSLSPATIVFLDKGVLQAGASKTRRTYESDKPQHFVVMVDLDRRMWSIKADGESWVEETPFPDAFQAGFSIESLDFSSQAGLGDQPNAIFAITNVKMTRVAPKA